MLSMSQSLLDEKHFKNLFKKIVPFYLLDIIRAIQITELHTWV